MSLRTEGAVRRARLGAGLRELWSARDLLRNLTVREVKVRYKSSALGFAWSMVTPLAMMAVFTFIFTEVFRTNIKDFPVFFLAAFLPWQYFSNSVMAAVGTVVANGGLIKKVYFPREVLPLSIVLSQLVHFCVSMLLFVVLLLVTGRNVLPMLPIVIGVIALQTIFNSGLAMGFAAANVGFRDLQELVQVIFLLWFYATPIFFPLEMAPPRFQALLRLNPMTSYVEMYRRLLYQAQMPTPRLLLGCVGSAVVALVVGYLFFVRRATTFAKEV